MSVNWDFVKSGELVSGLLESNGGEWGSVQDSEVDWSTVKSGEVDWDYVKSEVERNGKAKREYVQGD
jgi:hypothetical protein